MGAGDAPVADVHPHGAQWCSEVELPVAEPVVVGHAQGCDAEDEGQEDGEDDAAEESGQKISRDQGAAGLHISEGAQGHDERERR